MEIINIMDYYKNSKKNAKSLLKINQPFEKVKK